MMISVIFVLIAVFALLFFAWAAKWRASSSEVLENPAAHIRSVDIQAFQNLTSPEEEEFLRASLPPVEFHRIHRERQRAAIEYVSCAASNAAVLLRLAQAARQSGDPAAVQAAEKLIANAIRLRVYALQAVAQLYIGMFLPGTRISPMRIADRYEQMTRQVVMLGCLQYPTRRVSTAL